MTGMPGARQTFFEDVQLNVLVESPGMTITDAHVALFSSVSSNRSDAPAAVPDLLPLCLSSGLGWRVPQPPLVVLAFMGFEWRFHKPTRVGDTLHIVSTTVTKRAMKEGGVIIEERQIVNQRGEVVQSGRQTLLLAKRPSA
jgi:3-hydroxybutyryl-CoA dehydratase